MTVRPPRTRAPEIATIAAFAVIVLLDAVIMLPGARKRASARGERPGGG
ncbi:hypothetical protein [Streptosporangium oxazolinicum]